MTISSSISSAMSGLTAASRAAEIVSSNIANALTPGYGRREINLAARQVGQSGQGVRFVSVQRITNLFAIGERRQSEAGLGHSSARAAFYRRLETAIGVPDNSVSLTARIASFDAALLSAAARPDSEAKLSQVADSARAVATQIVSASKDVQSSRSRADEQIARDVEVINQTLAKIADLNTQIRTMSGGGDSSALQDQRQQAIDSLSAIVPLREIPRDGGTVALVTTGGAVLLDGPPAKLGFHQVGLITPEMSLNTGALSGLTLNGNLLDMGKPNGGLSGGRLAANFAIRDEISVESQAKLDAIARDLVERFQDPAVDQSLMPGDAGLFTDRGAAFDPLNEVGLSGRLQLNAAADPQLGGQLWRLRDGMYAAAPGPVSDSRLLNNMQTALTHMRQPVSGDFMAGTRSFAGLVGDYISTVSNYRLNAEGEESFAQGQSDALLTAELEDGVDTDAELQKLLLIEQAFSANAKVVQMADEMIKTLLGF